MTGARAANQAVAADFVGVMIRIVQLSAARGLFVVGSISSDLSRPFRSHEDWAIIDILDSLARRLTCERSS